MSTRLNHVHLSHHHFLPMTEQLFDVDLIRRYDLRGPRYTSYPTALQFNDDFDAASYLQCVAATNDDPIPSPLSLYFHVPFCSTICFYCACTKIVTRNRNHAEPYVRWLQQELALQSSCFDSDRVVEQLHFGGGTPTFLSRPLMADLMGTVRRLFALPADDSGEFSIEVDPRGVDAEEIGFLRDLGFNRISLGVQDLDPDVQRAVNRIQSLEETMGVVRAARDAGFRSVSMDLIYGLPHQTVESFAATLDRILEMAPDRLSVFNYAHLPGLFKTQTRINPDDLPSAEQKLQILQMTIDQLMAAGYEYIGMDHFARPQDELVAAQRNGTLSRSFQGYSTRGYCDLIGIGLSSIGRVGDCYSQNAKSMERYSGAIDAGCLPVEKGIRLTPDDQLRRALISSLICFFYVDLHAIERTWKIDFWEYFRRERELLRQFEDDGLLTIDADKIVVLPRGRLLIRNICMAFDRYLQEISQPGQFSRVL